MALFIAALFEERAPGVRISEVNGFKIWMHEAFTEAA